jgi:hypothetical protein
VGLEAAVHHTFVQLHRFYDGSPPAQQQRIDTYLQATGMVPMLAAALEVVGPHSLETADGLGKASHFFHKAKQALKGIPKLVLAALPFSGAIPTLFDGIDNIAENIADAIRPSSGNSPSTVEHPPGIPSVDIPGCTFHLIYEGKQSTTFALFHPNSTIDGKIVSGAGQGEVEVRVDGNIQPAPLQGYETLYTGTKIEVHFKSEAKNTANVGYKRI